LKDKRDRGNACPQGCEKRHRVDFVDDHVEIPGEPPAISLEGLPMHRPLSSRPHDPYTIEVLVRKSAWKRCRKPLNLIATGHHSAGYLMRQNLGTTSLRVAGTAPVQDEDTHAYG
jgi:hypothetical protein